jgi:hypothetical protein
MLPMGDMDGLNSAPGHSVANGGQGWSIIAPDLSPGVADVQTSL